MRLPPVSGLLYVILLWVSLVVAPSLHAAEPRPDMRVLIDISGSMKQTDPENLRLPAAKLLLKLASDGSAFGVWTFGQYVNNLVPLAKVSPEWQAQAVERLEAINSAGLFTNIGGALERAMQGQTRPDPDTERTIVLLSDGKVDIAKDPAQNRAETQRILQSLVPRLKQSGFRVHAVALSEAADRQFLEALALQTGGTFSLARNADELLEVFVAASDRANQPEQVPLEGDRFAIDDSVREFTALIFRQPGAGPTQLISPEGVTYSEEQGSRNLSWFADPRYDLITVYNPAPGSWQVMGDLDPNNRVTVVSDLQVVMSGLPENVLEGERLTMQMSLQEYGRNITNPNFLELMDITFRQTTADGETFEGKLSEDNDGTKVVPEDGVYQARLGRTITAGQHQFSVLVDGKTFKRKKTLPVTVYREVLKVETQYRDQDGEVLRYLQVEPVAGLVDPEQLELLAQITGPNGEKSIQSGIQTAAGQYRIDVPPGDSLGVYEVLIRVTGSSANGGEFELVQGPYTLDYTPLGMMAAAPEAEQTPLEPTQTFDAAAMEIPSLDVDLEVPELPPEDVPPLAETLPEPEPVMDVPAELTGELDQGEPEQQSTDNRFWWLVGAIVMGNVLVIGGGIFVYLKFLRHTAAEQDEVVEEITRLQQQRTPVSATAEATAEASAEPTQDPALADEEATQVRVAEADAGAHAAPAPEAEAEEPEAAYVNDAEPLDDLVEDELIEVDDELDADSLEDLDLMLSEHEAREQTEEQLNQTIDEMLEQPTVFPDQEAAETAAAGDKDVAEKSSAAADPGTEDDDGADKYPDFDHDEFMLDNPSKD